uniref:Large ribosomal subunit protein mL37 n=1 Tax=Romanomermis culicivorax TaxID=13658 RepID=A0A915L884_ROMCU
KYGIEVVDPLSPNFPHPKVVIPPPTNHPAFKDSRPEDHPLYKTSRCLSHDGSKPFAEGIKQALVLVKGIQRNGLPEKLFENVRKLDVDGMKDRVIKSIMQSQEWDPTFEKLPKRRDEKIWWFKWPSYYGIPQTRKNEILLDNMYRLTLSLSSRFPGIGRSNYFKNGQINAVYERGSDLVQVCCKPRATISSYAPLKILENCESVARTSQETVVDIYPISSKIDLVATNVYDDAPTHPLMWADTTSIPRTALLTKDINLDYPWTATETCANAIMAAFGLAASHAQLKYAAPGGKRYRGVLPQPIVTQCIQLCGGTFDFVVMQLNTLDMSNDDGVKNIVWIDKNNKLFQTVPFYETLKEVKEYNPEVVRKFLALTLNDTEG